MFFYLICNASIGNYQESKKKYLTTFIYGTIIYILLHAFLHTSSSQIAIYLKSYFWVIVGLDCAAMYYLYTYLNEETQEEGQKDLKTLLSSFYGQLTGQEDNQKDNQKDDSSEETSTNDPEKVGLDSSEPAQQKQKPNKNKDKVKDKSKKIEENLPEPEPAAYFSSQDLGSTPLSELPKFEDDLGSDSGSDVDLDKFEMTLQ